MEFSGVQFKSYSGLPCGLRHLTVRGRRETFDAAFVPWEMCSRRALPRVAEHDVVGRAVGLTSLGARLAPHDEPTEGRRERTCPYNRRQTSVAFLPSTAAAHTRIV